MAIKSYEELDVWNESINLVAEVYQAVKLLPKEELYALSDQIRRAAVSIPSNIAEGNQRQSTKEYIKFLFIAKGSLGELKTQIIICERLGYLDKEKVSFIKNRCDVIGRMISGLMRSLYVYLPQSQDPIPQSQKPPVPRPQTPAPRP